MVTDLIKNLLNFKEICQIILTLNTLENIAIPLSDKIIKIENNAPNGFGKNHNNAYKFCVQPYFCVLNPDIEFIENPFPALLNYLETENIALMAPVIISSEGKIEDSARKFPTAISIMKKIFFSYSGRWPLDLNKPLNYPDWVAGMFMLFPSSAYKQIGGFDENFFLYYEDVDICVRLRKQGHQIALCTQVKVIHNAQRASRKNVKFLYWHLKSLFRYLFLKSK